MSFVGFMRATGFVVLALVLLVFAFGLVAHEPMPDGEPGPAADALARRLEAYARPEAWAETRFVRWTFRGVNHHVWDRERGFARVTQGNKIVWLRLSDRTGVVRNDGIELHHERARRAREAAYARWVNDSFWLNPLVKLFDPGTSRELVPGQEGGLLVLYESGGVTPGDGYLWEVDAQQRPVAWRIWARILPIGGIRTTWEGWQELSTGARVSTEHRGRVGALRLTDVRGGRTWSDVGFEEDPFAPLFEVGSD